MRLSGGVGNSAGGRSFLEETGSVGGNAKAMRRPSGRGRRRRRTRKVEPCEFAARHYRAFSLQLRVSEVRHRHKKTVSREASIHTDCELDGSCACVEVLDAVHPAYKGVPKASLAARFGLALAARLLLAVYTHLTRRQ